MSIMIRPLAASDRPQWDRLFRAYIAFYRAAVSDSVIDLTWQRMLSGHPECHVGLAAITPDNQMLGFALMLFHRSTWAETHYCYLEDLFVDQAARGQGIGRRLIEAVYGEADRRGASRTYWVTETGNTPARQLYDRMATRADFVQYRR